MLQFFYFPTGCVFDILSNMQKKTGVYFNHCNADDRTDFDNTKGTNLECDPSECARSRSKWISNVKIHTHSIHS